MVARLRIFAAGLLLLPYATAFAQGQSIVDASSRTGLPSTVTLASLPTGFKAISLKTGSGGDFMSAYSPMMLFGMMNGGGRSSSDAGASRILELIQVSWTNGQSVATDAGAYLITYQPDWMSLMTGSSQAPQVKDVKLRLTLVRKDSITSYGPRDDITPEYFTAPLVAVQDVLAVDPSQRQSAYPATAKTKTLSNLKQIGLGMMMYMSDYDDVSPYAQDTRSAFGVLMPYIKNKEVFKSYNPVASRILMNLAVAGVNQSAIPLPAETVLFYDEKQWPDGTRLAVFCDGHAKAIDPADWARFERTLHIKLPKSGKPLPPNYWKQIGPDPTG